MVEKVKKEFEKFFKCIINLLFPVYELIEKNDKIEVKYNELNESEIIINEEYKQENEDEIYKGLNDYLIEDLKRKDKVEDKGKSILFIITLSVTFILGILKLLSGDKQLKLDSISTTFLLIIISYLVLATITTLKTVDTKGYSKLDLEKYNLEYSDDEKTINFRNNNNNNNNNKNKKGIIKELYKSIKLNEKLIMQKTNSLYCTLCLLNLSIFFMSLFFIDLLIKQFLICPIIRIRIDISLLVIMFIISKKIK